MKRLIEQSAFALFSSLLLSTELAVFADAKADAAPNKGKDPLVSPPSPSPSAAAGGTKIDSPIPTMLATYFSTIVDVDATSSVTTLSSEKTCPGSLDQQIDIDSEATLYYHIVRADSGDTNGILCGRLEVESNDGGWIGFGWSKNGKMTGGEAIVGLTDAQSVLKYNLASQMASDVTPMSVERQTLTNTSIQVVGDTTVMTFTKLLIEDGELEIYESGSNAFLHARGSDGENISYHDNGRVVFVKDFLDDVVPTNPPISTPSTAPVPSPSRTATPTDSAEFTPTISPNRTVTPSNVLTLSADESKACPGSLDQQIDFDSEATLYYHIVRADSGDTNGILCGRLEVVSNDGGWIGFGWSKNGKMTGGEAIVGLTYAQSVLKYNLASQMASDVTPMSVERQTLTDTSIQLVGDTTVMTFTKLLIEDGELEIYESGSNAFLHARGSDGENISYHDNGRVVFVKDFLDDVVPTNPPISTPSTAPVPSPSRTATPTDSAEFTPTIQLDLTTEPTRQKNTRLPISLSTENPTDSLSFLTPNPTTRPAKNPTESPINNPTTSPVQTPTAEPSVKSSASPSSSSEPSDLPSASPTVSSKPTISTSPTYSPTKTQFPTLPEYEYKRPKRVDMRWLPWNELDRDIQIEVSEALGYNKINWNNLKTNEVEKLRWSDLSERKKSAATKLGFDEWSWNCWMNNFESFSWKQLYEWELTPYLESLGWSKQKWNAQNGPPILKRYRWDELTNEQQESAMQLCFYKSSYDALNIADYGFGYPMEKPSARFVQWADLDPGMQATMEQALGYTEFNWNVPGLNPSELKGWFEMSDSEKRGAEAINCTDQCWDCWQAQYNTYGWQDLVNRGHDGAYAALGWTKSSWCGDSDAPPTNKKSWNELTEQEQLNATALCLNEFNWDQNSLAPNTSPFPYMTPPLRYIQWSSLTYDQQQIARTVLLYTEDSWNNVGTAGIEKRQFDDLTDFQKTYAVALGFYEKTWDCFQNHYRAETWSDLSSDVRFASEFLGWNQSSWNLPNTAPSVYGKRWNELTAEEQKAATVMCYFDVTWPSEKSYLGNFLGGTSFQLVGTSSKATRMSPTVIVVAALIVISLVHIFV